MIEKIKHIGILTSSRADYGIYLPLLKRLRSDERYVLSLIVFGTHLSPYHGMTVEIIQKDGFEVKHTINSLLLNDDENAVSTSTSLTMLKFAEFWKTYKTDFDLVFCLGDRFEMFGAVYAGIPYGIRFAHLHGGETTQGAIDNIYRHAITLASHIHFVSTQEYGKKVVEMTGSQNVFYIGSLSLDNLLDMDLIDNEEMCDRFGVDFSIPSILVTVHPETVNSAKNQEIVEVCRKLLNTLSRTYQIVITMPNADTMGSILRREFVKLQLASPEKIKLVENFGTQAYFSAMKLSSFMIGNTSSGIIEAASFGKFVINLGDRQAGRLRSTNVIDCEFDQDCILAAVYKIEKSTPYQGENIYHAGGACNAIIKAIENV